MKAKILNKIPISGTNPEKHFGHFRNSVMWVEFEDDDNEHWNASFAKDYDQGFNGMVLDNKNKTAFVVAGGQGYLVDTYNRSLLLQTEPPECILSVVHSEKHEFIIFSDFWKICFYKGHELVKQLHPVNVDGIYFTESSGDTVFGHVEKISTQRLNIVFELDLRTFEFKYHREKIQEPWGQQGFNEKVERDKNKKSILDKLKSLFKP